MSPFLEDLLGKTIMQSIATGIAKHNGDTEAYNKLKGEAAAYYKALTEELDRLEANQQSPRPPAFYRKDQEPVGGEELPVAMRYS